MKKKTNATKILNKAIKSTIKLENNLQSCSAFWTIATELSIEADRRIKALEDKFGSDSFWKTSLEQRKAIKADFVLQIVDIEELGAVSEAAIEGFRHCAVDWQAAGIHFTFTENKQGETK